MGIIQMLFGVMYRKSNVGRKGGPVGVSGGSLESRPPVLVLPLRQRSESATCSDHKYLHDVWPAHWHSA